MTEDSVLKTLRRVPDRIILAVMGRDLDLEFPNTCLCGWFIREKLAEMQNVGASEVFAFHETLNGPIPSRCVTLFGGDSHEWSDIFWGVVGKRDGFDAFEGRALIATIETAFVRRVDEACQTTSQRAIRKAMKRVVRRKPA